MKLINNIFHKISFFFLKRKKRYRIGFTKIFGKRIKYADASSFVFMYNEIFVNHVYNFHSNKKKPKIIDCGANIGLSVIYFKYIYPHSKIVAFEPDPKIFEILRYNIGNFNLDCINLVQKGLWSKEKEIFFYSEGADAGRVIDNITENSLIIKTDLLSKYLNEEIDLLKIDIEGAEFIVLNEASVKLKNVRNIFIESHSFINKDQKLDKILSLLRKNGFKYYVTSPGLTSKNPFIKINTYQGMDMQLNIYAIRTEK